MTEIGKEGGTGQFLLLFFLEFSLALAVECRLMTGRPKSLTSAQE